MFINSVSRRTAFLMVIILFFADIGIGVSGELVNNKNSDFEIELQRNPAILVDGLPPLMCDYDGEELPCDTPIRMPDRGDKIAAVSYTHLTLPTSDLV